MRLIFCESSMVGNEILAPREDGPVSKVAGGLGLYVGEKDHRNLLSIRKNKVTNRRDTVHLHPLPQDKCDRIRALFMISLTTKQSQEEEVQEGNTCEQTPSLYERTLLQKM